ncbi:MAG: NDP-hexose 2,3-dehydratase family protein [Clostridium sp.]
MEGFKNNIIKIIESWANEEGNVNSTNEIIEWINNINNTTEVSIKESCIDDSTFWFYDDYNGEILNRKRSFFSIKGMQMFRNDELIIEQPIINQPEIGYLGIICKEFDGIMNFLMQAKIEPGNINSVQISPTIQATKSNFTRVHGGVLPKYFDFFEKSEKYTIIMDQIQSEQATRFYKKRNRNIIIKIEEDIEVYSNYKWMTLGQIKKLMHIDNLVNMDTRTVLSGIPLITSTYNKEELKYIRSLFKDKSFFSSIFYGENAESIIKIYNFINNFKMFHNEKIVTVPLNHLISWKVTNSGVICKRPSNFIIKYYDISIKGREVQNWSQPLFKAIGKGIFALLTSIENGKRKYLVSAKSEIGSFDKIEIGPSIQIEPVYCEDKFNIIENKFMEKLKNNEGIIFDVMLSEEGGRFYHEQNRNIIMEVNKKEFKEIDGYFWVDYSTLNYLIQVNNCLNIQLRNLLSLLEV